MRQIAVEGAGGYERLEVREVPRPAPGPGEVLVDVEAIGVNYADCLVRRGLYASAKVYVGWPITPGFEVAGRVAAIGAGVTQWSVGQDVVALTRFGAYCEALVVPEGQVFVRPPGLTAVQAAAFPVAYLTAWYALELGAVGPDDVVLVHSAAGGVGLALVRLARRRGARVVGVIGTESKRAAAEEAGAEVLAKGPALWPALESKAPLGFDAVFDANGVETLRRSYDHLRPGGRLVVYGFHTMVPRAGVGWLRGMAHLVWSWLRTPRFSPLDMTTSNRSVLAFNLSFMFDRTEVLHRAIAAVTQAELGSTPITTYPLALVGAAHRDLESGQTVGKLVLVP